MGYENQLARAIWYLFCFVCSRRSVFNRIFFCTILLNHSKTKNYFEFYYNLVNIFFIFIFTQKKKVNKNNGNLQREKYKINLREQIKTKHTLIRN